MVRIHSTVEKRAKRMPDTTVKTSDILDLFFALEIIQKPGLRFTNYSTSLTLFHHVHGS